MSDETQRTEGEQDQAVGEDLEPKAAPPAAEQDWMLGHDADSTPTPAEVPGTPITDEQVKEFEETGTVSDPHAVQEDPEEHLGEVAPDPWDKTDENA